jgi:hypothetical protein
MKLHLRVAVVFIAMGAGFASAQSLIFGWAQPANAPTTGLCSSMSMGGTPGYCAYQSAVMPNIDGNTILARWKDIETSENVYDYSILDAILAGAGSNIGYQYNTCRGGTPCIINLVVSLVTNGGVNTDTPTYLFGPSWMDLGSTFPAWTPITTYFPNSTSIPLAGNGGSVVIPPFTQTPQHYYQNQTSGGVASCISGATAPPPTDWSMSSFTEGSCLWVDLGTVPPALDVCFGSDYTGSGSPEQGSNKCYNNGTNKTGFPAIWEPPFANRAQKLYNNVVQHFSGGIETYQGQILYIRLGIAVGGEAFPWDAPQLKNLLSLNTNDQLKQVWLNYAASVYANNAATLAAQFPAPSWKLMAGVNYGPNKDITWADSEAASAAAQGLVIGSEALQSSDQTAYASGTPCSNDWCSIFNQYVFSVPIRESQTAGLACPLPNESDCTNIHAGSLTNLFVFGVQRHISHFEIFGNDLRCAFDSSYHSGGGTGYTSGPTYAECQVANYQTAFANAVAGTPAGTLMITGRINLNAVLSSN